MQNIHFSIHINAPKEKVWNTMLEDATYRKWTTAFSPGSHYVGGWDEGSEIKFFGNDEKGNPSTEGMYSRIKENRKHEFISIEHLGMIKDGVVDTTSEAVKKWLPAFENYTFKEVDGGTELLIDIDITDEYKVMFENMWPRALQVLKELSERA